MKPELLKVAPAPACSFSVRQDAVPRMNNRWHFHPEVELILFHRGSGMQFVGDSVLPFAPGDIVLVGANLPHYWRFDDDYQRESELSAPFATVAHFTETFWGTPFLNLPENQPLKALLYRAQRGLLLPSGASAALRPRFERLVQTQGPWRIVALLNCLLALAAHDELHVLSSEGFGYDTADTDDERLNAVYQYTLTHFRRRIGLAEVAAVAGLVPPAFCRYFKGRMGKTYFRFLLEIRVSRARQLLLETDLSIKDLCFESGFGNSADFHKSFKQLTGKTPLAYQRETGQLAAALQQK